MVRNASCASSALMMAVLAMHADAFVVTDVKFMAGQRGGASPAFCLRASVGDRGATADSMGEVTARLEDGNKSNCEQKKESRRARDR